MSADRPSLQQGTTADATSVAAAGLWSSPWRTTSVSMLLSIGVVAFDELGVTTALPRVAAELGGLSTYGWAISAVVLATLMGSAVSGHLADQRGPALPSAVGFGVFTVGLIVSGAASGWAVFLVGRAIQGLGAGAVVAMVYVVIMRRLPTELRSRALALVSSAWMIPSLVGPAVSGLITDLVGWRAVFGMLLGFSVLAGVASLWINRSIAAPDRSSADGVGVSGGVGGGESGLASVLAATVWSGALVLAVVVVLVGLELDRAWAGGLLVAAGAVGAVMALRRLVPPGTLRVQRGLPAGVASRLLLAVGFFGPSSFLALLLIEVRGTDATLAGVVLSIGSLAWVAGAAFQARTDYGKGRHRPAQILAGHLALALGLGSVAVVLLATSRPIALAGVGWALAGLGMGLSYNVTTTATLDHTTRGNQGSASSALQIAQTLGTAVAAGLGTAVLAHDPQHPTQGFAVLFGIALLAVLATLPMARRTI